MVSYTEWTTAVHDAYKAAGGTYPTQGVVQALTRAAADFWERNKEELKGLAVDAAVTVARELMQELTGGRLSGEYAVSL